MHLEMSHETTKRGANPFASPSKGFAKRFGRAAVRDFRAESLSWVGHVGADSARGMYGLKDHRVSCARRSSPASP